MNFTARLVVSNILLLAALQWAWHGWLFPPAESSPWPVVLFCMLPILPAVVLAIMRHRRAGFWGALAALLYFCHGVMVAWSTPEARALALLEVGLSIVLVLASSWDGMRARFRGKPPAPPAV